MFKPAGRSHRLLSSIVTHGAVAEAFLVHVVLNGAANGRVEICGRLPAEIPLGRLDRRHAYLDVLVVLAVVLTRGDIDDLSALGVFTQNRKFLRNANGALSQIADGHAIVRIADVENTPARALILVLEDGEQRFHSIVD